MVICVSKRRRTDFLDWVYWLFFGWWELWYQSLPSIVFFGFSHDPHGMGDVQWAANGIGWLDDCWFSMIILNHSNQILTKSCKHKENLYENCFFNNTVGCLIILSTTKQPGSIFVHGTSPFAWLSPRRSNLAMENQPVRLSCVKSLEGNTNSTPTVLCFNQCNLHMFYIVLHLTTLNYTYFDG